MGTTAPFWSGECAGSAIPPVNLNNAHFDAKNGVIGQKNEPFQQTKSYDFSQLAWPDPVMPKLII